jgi:hypothetical protein
VGRRGLEPRTYGLKVRSSTIELATRIDELGPARDTSIRPTCHPNGQHFVQSRPT